MNPYVYPWDPVRNPDETGTVNIHTFLSRGLQISKHLFCYNGKPVVDPCGDKTLAHHLIASRKKHNANYNKFDP